MRHGERMFDRDDQQHPSTAGGTAAATRAVGYILRHAVSVNAVDPEEVALRRRGCHRSAGPPLPAQSGAVLLLPAPQWGSRTRPRALPPQLPLVRPRKPVAAPPPWLSTQPGVPPPPAHAEGAVSRPAHAECYPTPTLTPAVAARAAEGGGTSASAEAGLWGPGCLPAHRHQAEPSRRHPGPRPLHRWKCVVGHR